MPGEAGTHDLPKQNGRPTCLVVPTAFHCGFRCACRLGSFQASQRTTDGRVAPLASTCVPL